MAVELDWQDLSSVASLLERTSNEQGATVIRESQHDQTDASSVFIVFDPKPVTRRREPTASFTSLLPTLERCEHLSVLPSAFLGHRYTFLGHFPQRNPGDGVLGASWGDLLTIC